MRARAFNFCFVALVMAAVALTLGSTLLLRAALCMAIMLILSLLSVSLAYATARITLPSRALTLTRGERAAGEVKLDYFSLLPMGSLAYSLDTGRTLRFGGAPFASSKKRMAIEAPHVGVYPYGSGTLYMTDVFNLFVFSKRFTFDDAFITVMPASFETDKPENRSLNTGAGTVRLSDDADEPNGIREWVQGDLLKRVHWKLSSKTWNPIDQSIRPIVKTYEEATRPDILVLPDLSLIDAPDETVSLLRDGICEGALSLCRAVVEGGETVRLMLCTEESREYAASGSEALREFALALANASFGSLVSFETLAGEAMRRVGTTSAVAFVTTRLDERVTDMLIKLRGYSGMNVSVLYVCESASSHGALSQARLEAVGIPVMRHIPAVKGASA